jgi:hypothetical protein
MKRITMALAVAGGLAAAVPASAGYTVQGIPGTNCTADRRIGGPWEYRGRRLLAVGTEDPWDSVIAVCPIALFVPGQQPREYRIQLADSQQRDTWCQVYSYSGALVRMHNGVGGTWSFSGSLASPLSWPGGLVEASIHCLVRPGASLERIEIVWWRP